MPDEPLEKRPDNATWKTDMNQSEFEALVWDEANIAAAETCGPNAHEYISICERLNDCPRFAEEVAQRHGVTLNEFGEVVDSTQGV